ncbi:MAG: cyclase family protein [Firmicutes bacterium]|nr:cyclase family protein [Bacillota bacterium]
MLVDLSMPLGPRVTPVSGHPPFSSRPITTLEKDGRANSHVSFSIHTATHVDAPSHFVPGGLTIDQVPLRRFTGEAYVVHLAPPPAARQAIDLDLLRRSGLPDAAVLRDRILVLHSGWTDAHGHSPDLYTHNPYLAEESARWIVDAGVAMLGVDFGVDGGFADTPVYTIHPILLGAGIPILENLVGLHRLRRSPFTLTAFPVCLEGENGGPARAVAVVDEEG